MNVSTTMQARHRRGLRRAITKRLRLSDSQRKRSFLVGSPNSRNYPTTVLHRTADLDWIEDICRTPLVGTLSVDPRLGHFRAPTIEQATVMLRSGSNAE